MIFDFIRLKRDGMEKHTKNVLKDISKSSYFSNKFNPDKSGIERHTPYDFMTLRVWDINPNTSYIIELVGDEIKKRNININNRKYIIHDNYVDFYFY